MYLGLIGLILLVATSAQAEYEKERSLAEEITAGFDATVRVLGFGTTTEPADTLRNPDNRILNIARYSAALHLRPDFRIDRHDLTLSLQPRAELQWDAWREGPREGDEHWRDTVYIHQWLARWRAVDALHFSYGRENLQWGPAYLTSLSNPFFLDNGRNNPKIEVQSMDFGRLVWVPEVAWSLSLIVNTDAGRNEAAETDFSRTWALKADYNGDADYAGLVLSGREDARRQVGGFYGRTLSDALLVYAEGAVLQNPGGRYPERADALFGSAMRTFDDHDSFRGSGLAGAAYTLAAGPTLGIEYLYYGPGYNGREADRFFDLQESASAALDPPNPLTPEAYAALGLTADPGLRFLRRNYLMLQYLHNDIAGTVDTVLRWTRNLDDGSGRLTSIVEWSPGDHVALFGIATLNRGSARSEFGSIFDYQVMLGVEYTF